MTPGKQKRCRVVRRELAADLERAGFVRVTGGTGSVILSGDDGDDAKHYQEKQVQAALKEVTR